MKAILSNGICGEKIFKQRGKFKGGENMAFYWLNAEAFKFSLFEEQFWETVWRKKFYKDTTTKQIFSKVSSLVRIGQYLLQNVEVQQ